MEILNTFLILLKTAILLYVPFFIAALNVTKMHITFPPPVCPM